MKRLIVLIILIGLTLSVWGQPPSVEIVTPVSGYYVTPANQELGQSYNTLLVLDTFDGNITTFSSPRRILNTPIWDSSTNNISLYGYDDSSGENGYGMDIVEPFVSNLTRSIQGNGVLYPMSWIGNEILYVYFDGSYSLRIINLDTSQITSLMEYSYGQDVSHLLYNTRDVTFAQIDFADWNPVYSDWMLIQFAVNYFDPNLNMELSGFVVVLYSLKDGQHIALNNLLTDDPFIYKSQWSNNGRYLFVETVDNSFNIISFNPDTLAVNQVAAVTKLSNLVVLDWFGVSDLLLLSDGHITYLAEVVNDQLFTQEFFRFDSSRIGQGDWKFTGTPEEAAELSCIFDETLPTRLEIGAQAQVAFTGGTPSRLRSEPSTWVDVVQSLPEGTTFEIIGGYMCGSGYRWWQVQLADGTQGWIAEASETEYWIEPR